MEYKRVQSFNVEDPETTLYNKIVDELTKVVEDEDIVKSGPNEFHFTPIEFEHALPFILEDQRSALRKDKLKPSEFVERFNRWFMFCDTIVNLGVSCLYKKESVNNEDYETIFKTLKVNAAFNERFLEPHGIKIVFTTPNSEAQTNYPWLSLPYLSLKDDNGVDQLIRLTTTKHHSVWWFDLLEELHNRANWEWAVPVRTDHSTVEDPVGFLERVDAATIEAVSQALPVPSATLLEVTEEEEEAFKLIEDNDKLLRQYEQGESFYVGYTNEIFEKSKKLKWTIACIVSIIAAVTIVAVNYFKV